MSRFDLSIAKQIAEKAVRRRETKSAAGREVKVPLRGREAALLVALQEAERAHDTALKAIVAEEERLKAFEPTRQQHRKFTRNIEAAIEDWEDMGQDGRLGIAWHAHAMGAPGSDWDGSTNEYLDSIVQRMNVGLRELLRASVSASQLEFVRGRKPKVGQKNDEKTRLEPLFAVAAVLKRFWKRETGLEFGRELDDLAGPGLRRQPKSAASRLLWETSRYFDQDYTLSNVETVMRELQTSVK